MKERGVFEKIIDGELPHTKVYEDNFSYAFLDGRPNTLGHTLVVSKTSFRNILDIDSDHLQHLIVATQKVARMLYEKMPNCKGVNIIQNSEPAAGQVVFHIHFHVVPRYEGDGLHPWPGDPLTSEAIEEVKSYLGL